MRIYSPLYGWISIPGNKADILAELNYITNMIYRNYDRWLQAQIDALEEGLEVLYWQKKGLKL